eukprot:scaffold69193_cov66-Phaeocystis_antarctica.AAC.2
MVGGEMGPSRRMGGRLSRRRPGARSPGARACSRAERAASVGSAAPPAAGHCSAAGAPTPPQPSPDRATARPPRPTSWQPPPAAAPARGSGGSLGPAPAAAPGYGASRSAVSPSTGTCERQERCRECASWRLAERPAGGGEAPTAAARMSAFQESPAVWQGSREEVFAARRLMLAAIASPASRQTTSLRKASVQWN